MTAVKNLLETLYHEVIPMKGFEDKLEVLSTNPRQDQRFTTIKSLLDDFVSADLVMNGAVESQTSGITEETGAHKAPLNF